MANFLMGVTRGKTQNPGNVLISITTTAGNDIELRADTGKNLTRKDLIDALHLFEMYILSNGLPGGNIGTDLPPK